MDQPKARLGAMLADVELMGISHRIVIGERNLANGEVEYQGRQDSDSQNIALNDTIEFLTRKINCQ